MKANHSPILSIYLCSIIYELNTEHDAVHVAGHIASLQVEGVPGLQSLVHRAPTSGPHLANAVTVVVGVV